MSTRDNNACAWTVHGELLAWFHDLIQELIQFINTEIRQAAVRCGLLMNQSTGLSRKEKKKNYDNITLKNIRTRYKSAEPVL